MATTIATLDCYTTGHGCFEPKKIIEASTNVFSGGKGVARVDDKTEDHTCGNTTHSANSRKITTGSNKVYVNGKKCARLGSDVACGDAIGNHNLPEGAKRTYVGG